jgi:hypothetical protein
MRSYFASGYLTAIVSPVTTSRTVTLGIRIFSFEKDRALDRDGLLVTV